jgi:HSP20 family protein
VQVRRWDPFTVLARMDRDFDDLVRRTWGETAQAGFVPACEVVRRDGDVAIRFELPGVDVERDVTIEVERGKLVVSGERRDPLAASGDGEVDRSALLVRELRYGAFRREFALPQGVSPEQVEASYDAGILEVLVRAVVAPEPTPVRVPIATSGARPAVVEHVADGQPAVEA